MEKKHDFAHRFVHRGAVGECRIRVYEELGERPVVVATQGFDPWGQPEPLIMSDGAKTIAADLIAVGIVPGSYRATTAEMLEKIMWTGDATPLRNSAPFWFVVESLQLRHQLFYLWFVAYYNTTVGEIGNIAFRDETTPGNVEALIGASLHE